MLPESVSRSRVDLTCVPPVVASTADHSERFQEANACREGPRNGLDGPEGREWHCVYRPKRTKFEGVKSSFARLFSAAPQFCTLSPILEARLSLLLSSLLGLEILVGKVGGRAADEHDSVDTDAQAGGVAGRCGGGDGAGLGSLGGWVAGLCRGDCALAWPLIVIVQKEQCAWSLFGGSGSCFRPSRMYR